MKFIWFGHSSLLLNLDGRIILTDPVFSSSASPFRFMFRRFQPPAASLDAFPPVDIILLSHDHYDHLDESSIRFFRDKQTRFIAPLRMSNHLRKWGIAPERIRELDWFETHHDGDLAFTAAPARHYSGRGMFDHNKTLWASWVIQGKTERIFFSGDSGYDSHFKTIGERCGPFDLAFIENGQYDARWPDSHMMPEESIQAAADVNAKTFMPIHWGMFSLAFHSWSEPAVRIRQLAQARRLAMIAPRLGEIADRHLPLAAAPWWELENARLPAAVRDAVRQGTQIE